MTRMESASILENRKNYQRNKILHIIRFHENTSRNDVKKISSYSMTTVSNTVNEMVSEGLIFEEECEEERVGRKPTWLRINPDGGYFIGVEFNRNSMQCVILNFIGKTIYSEGRQIDRKRDDSDSVVQYLLDSLQTALERLGDKQDRVIGIGVGVPGYSDISKGISISYNHIKGWKNIPVKQIVEDRFNVPCYIENNVNVMIYAYKWLVYKGRCENMLFISIRTGTRVMPIINNQPVSSNGGYPGELGHIKIRGSSRLCACGRYGCLNSEISDVAIVNKINDGIQIGRFSEINDMVKGDRDKITMSVFVKSVLAKHQDSLKLEKQVAEYLGETLGMLVNIFAPKKIVLFGELTGIGDIFLQDVKRHVENDTIIENLQNLEIVYSQFGRDLGAKGAATLVLEKAFPFAREKI